MINVLTRMFLAVFCTTWLINYSAFNSWAKGIKHETVAYKEPELGWDRVDYFCYQDSINLILYSGFKEKPDAFSLSIENPYQFLYAERDEDSLIQNCVFQQGGYFDGKSNSQWPGSLIREIVRDDDFSKRLKPELRLLINQAVFFLEKNQEDN